MSLAALLAAALFQGAAPPFAADGIAWVQLPAGPTVRTEYDPASIRREGNRATVMLRSAPVDPAAQKSMALMIVDCAGRTFGLRIVHRYAPDGTHRRTEETPADEVVMLSLSGGGLDELRSRVCREE